MTGDPSTVTDVLQWTVVAPSRVNQWAQRLARGVDVLWVVATLGQASTGASPPPLGTLPDDPDEFLDLRTIKLRGHAPWLPGEAVHGATVRVSSRSAWAFGSDLRPPTQVPLSELTCVRASCDRRGGVARRKRADAPWVFSMVGAGAEIWLSGTWLSLAWLGHLGGWAEPD